jgi:hypothetical protein
VRALIQVRYTSCVPAAGPALITRATAGKLGVAPTADRTFLCLAHGSDCMLAAKVLDDAAGRVADGQVAVTAVQQYNLHLGAGVRDDFRRAAVLCSMLAGNLPVAPMLHMGRSRQHLGLKGVGTMLQHRKLSAVCARLS